MCFLEKKKGGRRSSFGREVRAMGEGTLASSRRTLGPNETRARAREIESAPLTLAISADSQRDHAHT